MTRSPQFLTSKDMELHKFENHLFDVTDFIRAALEVRVPYLITVSVRPSVRQHFCNHSMN